MDCIAQSDGAFFPYGGGSPYNVARAVARQGKTVIFANPISTDGFGQQLAEQLIRDGAHLGMPRNALPTSLAIVIFPTGDRKQPRYQFYREGVADRAFTEAQALAYLASFPAPGVLHTGSLALVPPEAHKTLAIVRAARALGWTISMDINLRPRLAQDMDAYCAIMMEFITCADWLKASDEDLETLLQGGHTLAGLVGADVSYERAPALAAPLIAMGVQRLALTFGAQGAYLQVGAKHAQAAAPVVQVVDTVGAGDTFWGTCLVDWVGSVDWSGGNTPPVTATLHKALKAAALNCTVTGCNPPTRAELL